ncbi:MAG: monofunctional biosynthetic peptidoglycan transglycosylase [Paludibacter sp.]|nr:monofunctional biosynthetic peptidoglycan transglycosylase [Paludibacter sp.]
MNNKGRFWRKVLRILRNLIILFFVSSIGLTILARFVPVLITPLMIIRSVEAIADGKAPKNSKQWVSIEQISPHMIRAVIAAEDNLFMEHNGFSFEDIQKAWEHNKKGKRIRGGSTISQQTAKNVFLWNKRSYVRKALEAYFTVLIELFWSKERIMEVYLNVIETGNGIYGVQAASLEHFGKDAAKLSRSQAALIAVCLPNPRRFNPARPSPYIQRRKNQILGLMNKIPFDGFETPKKKP